MTDPKKSLLSVNETAKTLKIQGVTLRKYSVLVETVLGDPLRFRADIHQHRLYSDDDILSFSNAVKMKRAGVPLKLALRVAFESCGTDPELSEDEKIEEFRTDLNTLSERLDKIEYQYRKLSRHWWNK
ncbi:hypothetical protein DA076_02515 [Lactiplantibacillus plantarum]|uniref:hypothetical protein n=1 Tax=Lactiplantibacillus plantarum TaxID=1590 RepID=UPI000D204425|nr:hypothetical protein [Lactiplantibacillus plantarum]AVW06686.1 hypothetical protein DA076_02515 [Lactiplantibacillus plantarum]